jgi:Stress responsive A/B Barrel Domain
MIRHVALFTWTDGMTEAMEQQFAAELTDFATTQPGLLAYHVGPDLGINEGSFDFAVVADFDDVDSYVAYRDSAGHQDIIQRLSRPNTKSRAAVQYEI